MSSSKGGDKTNNLQMVQSCTEENAVLFSADEMLNQDLGSIGTYFLVACLSATVPQLLSNMHITEVHHELVQNILII